MRCTVLVVTLALLLDAGAACAGDQGGAPGVLTFEDSESDRPPAGFTTALTGDGGRPVSWLVREDPTAPSGRRVLMQTSADPTHSRFPLCIHDAFSSADVTLSVKFKAVGGTIDQAAGLVWRYQNPSTYYLVRANALEGNVVLYKVENGKRSDLKPVGSGLFTYGQKAGVATGRWQTLKVDVKGTRFSVFLDGKHLFDVEDSTFRASGKVGLWTKADSVTAFDDFAISQAASNETSPAAHSSTPPKSP